MMVSLSTPGERWKSQFRRRPGHSSERRAISPASNRQPEIRWFFSIYQRVIQQLGQL